MQINKALNLTFPIDHEGGPAWVHSTPLSREVFERHFLIISKTFSAIYTQDLIPAGPRVAAMMLRKVAAQAGLLEGPEGVDALLNEMRRMTSVIVHSDTGWEPIPLQIAKDREFLDEDEVSEVEGIVAFFICISAMLNKTHRLGFNEAIRSACNGQIVSSNSTEFARSLPTSTPGVHSGKKAASSVPH